MSRLELCAHLFWNISVYKVNARVLRFASSLHGIVQSGKLKPGKTALHLTKHTTSNDMWND